MGGFLSNSKFSNRAAGDLVKNVLVFGLLVLFTSQVGIGLVKTVSGFTLGRLARNMLPALFVGGLLFVVLLIKDFGFLKQKRSISLFFTHDLLTLSYKTLLLILTVAFLFALIIIKFSFLGPMYILIGVACILGLLSALIFIIIYDDFRGLAILLAIYPFILFIQHYFRWKLSIDPYENHSISIFMPHEIVWLLILLALIIHKLINKERFQLIGIQKLFIIFGFFLLVSALFSPIPLTSLGYVYRDSFLPLVFLFIFTDRIKTTNDFKWLFRAVIFSGMVELFITIYFFWRAGGFYTSTQELFRSDLAITVGGYVNLISILSLILLPMAAIACFYEKNMAIKMFSLASFIICAGVIILSRNRSAQMSILFTLPILFLYGKIKLRYILFPIGIIITLAVTLKVPYVRYMLTERYQRWFMGGGIVPNILASDSVSIDLWTSAVKIFLDHPFFGIGAGMWEEVYPNYASMPWIVVLLSGNKPHSLLLQYFAFAGLGAGLSCVLIYLYTIIKCVKPIFTLKQTDLYLPILGLFWSITALSLHEIIRGYQIFNYYGYTVMGICLFFGLDNLVIKTRKSSPVSMIANQK